MWRACACALLVLVTAQTTDAKGACRRLDAVFRDGSRVRALSSQSRDADAVHRYRRGRLAALAGGSEPCRLGRQPGFVGTRRGARFVSSDRRSTSGNGNRHAADPGAVARDACRVSRPGLAGKGRRVARAKLVRRQAMDAGLCEGRVAARLRSQRSRAADRAAATRRTAAAQAISASRDHGSQGRRFPCFWTPVPRLG